MGQNRIASLESLSLSRARSPPPVVADSDQRLTSVYAGMSSSGTCSSSVVDRRGRSYSHCLEIYRLKKIISEVLEATQVNDVSVRRKTEREKEGALIPREIKRDAERAQSHPAIPSEAKR